MNENFDITYKALFRRYYPNLIFKSGKTRRAA